ncbi:deoxyribonuclease-2 [Oesophagostomum dentatum]|uniref:Deoxyribonuclease-2 n=1 Tax=Oesophagostomum dentatum TaxID=61180 RepID=A0A0B1T7E2_OESDE|nr:deoxyribonuclease-2 [Oesophagostomum dentatum]
MPVESSDNSVPGIQKGVAWYYVDSNNKGALAPSSKTLDDKEQAIAYTLNQYYTKKTDPTIFHVMYNDEPYNSTDPSLLDILLLSNRAELATIQFGHTKGTMFFDETSGVWLIHSVPKFPPPDHYEYPASGHDYGQTMLCLSFNYAALSNIATQLYYNKPNIYSSQLPTKIAADYPVLSQVIAGKYKQGEPYSSTVTLNTINGQKFTSFAKTNQFNNAALKRLNDNSTNLVLTVPLSCSTTYHTNDALQIQVGTTSEFKYTKDHSKMARSTDPTKPWVCIGDINRMP